MLIVLEGCDGSGKTTVANHLLNTLPNAEIVHCTTDTPNDWDFFSKLIEASKTRNIIADRFCYGQFVYQREEERHLTFKQLWDLEILMMKACAKVIHVAAPVREITERLALRGEETHLSVATLCDTYLNLFENCTLIKPYVWWTGRSDD